MNETTPSAANDDIPTIPRIFRRGRFWWCKGARKLSHGPDPVAAFKAWRRVLAG